MSLFYDFRIAYGFSSVDATVSSPSSEQSPDGLAANSVLHGKGRWGKPWVATAAATTMNATITFGSSVNPTFVAVVTNAASTATITLHRDPASSNTLEATLLQCLPTKTWARFVTTTAHTTWKITVTDASGVDPLIVHFAAIGTYVQLSGGATVPRSESEHLDPSIEIPMKNGSTTFNPQDRPFRKTFDVHGAFADDSLSELRTALQTVGKTEPVFVTTDAQSFNDYGNSVLGHFESVPVVPIEGAMTRYPLTIKEIRS